MMLDDLRLFLQRAKQYFEVPKIKFRVDKDSKEDIWCFPDLGLIVVGKKWIKAWNKNKKEAEKRVIHEVLGHLKLGLPDNIKQIHFYSSPWRDMFSAAAYEMMQLGIPYSYQTHISFLNDYLKDKYWIQKWKRSGKIGYEKQHVLRE